jgi:hypothetical protein
MTEPHPDVQAALDAAGGLEQADPAERVTRLESIAARLEASLSDSAG